MSKKVGIILRTKDRKLFFARAIQSIIAQTYKYYHVYVINDGGDNRCIEEVLNELSSSDRERFSVINLPTSTKRGGALAIGINSTSEKYIHIHDDDDTLEPEFLEKTVSYLENDPEKIFSAVMTSNYDVYEEVVDQEIIEINKTDQYGKRDNGVYDYGLFLAHNSTIIPIALLIRREAIRLVGSVNPNMEYVEDNEFFLRLLQYGDIAIIGELLCAYHWKASSKNKEKFVGFSQEECGYSHIIYKNNVIREAISGKGTLRVLQAEALKDKAVSDYHRTHMMLELSNLNNSFLNMVNIFYDFINKVNNK